jgi:hypothetical protein
MAHYPTVPSYNIHEAAPEPAPREKIEAAVEPESIVEQTDIAPEKRTKRKRALEKTVLLFNKFTASVRNLRHRFKKLKEPVELIPSENPDIVEAPKLVHLVESKAQTIVLLQHGFSVDTMLENDISLQDLRDNEYTMQDLQRLFNTWTGLKTAGFTKHHMDSELWSLDLLSSLFQVEHQYSGLAATNSLLFAQEMNFTLDDYLRTLPNTSALAAILNADGLLQHDIKFRHIFKMHLTPECFKNEFGATKEHFLQLRDRVNAVQFEALASGCNWNMYNLRRVFQLEASETPLRLTVH